MQIGEIVNFWSQVCRDADTGRWTHPADRDVLSEANSFNLDYPISPYVGHILTAKVIILGANAGYNPSMTPSEFPTDRSIDSYIQRVRDPENSDWSFVSDYYGRVNYSQLILDGEAALINASPYRSPKISEEPDNRKAIDKLPSTTFNRRWLLEAILPLALNGERLIVAKRHGLWKLPDRVKNSVGVAVDPAPVSPQITSTAWAATQQFLSK